MRNSISQPWEEERCMRNSILSPMGREVYAHQYRLTMGGRRVCASVPSVP